MGEEDMVGCFENFGWQDLGTEDVQGMLETCRVERDAGKYCMEDRE